MNNGQKHRSDYDGGQQSAGQSLGSQSSRQRQADSDRSRISLFTAPSSNQPNGTWECYSRASEEAECQRLITIAKNNGLFFNYEETLRFKQPAPLVIEWLLSKECSMWRHSEELFNGYSSTSSLFSKVREWFTNLFE